MKVEVELERLVALKTQLQMMLMELEGQIAGLTQNRKSQQVARQKQFEAEFIRKRARSLQKSKGDD
jgi:hypothetical protein